MGSSEAKKTIALSYKHHSTQQTPQVASKPDKSYPFLNMNRASVPVPCEPSTVAFQAERRSFRGKHHCAIDMCVFQQMRQSLVQTAKYVHCSRWPKLHNTRGKQRKKSCQTAWKLQGRASSIFTHSTRAHHSVPCSLASSGRIKGPLRTTPSIYCFRLKIGSLALSGYVDICLAAKGAFIGEKIAFKNFLHKTQTHYVCTEK